MKPIKPNDTIDKAGPGASMDAFEAGLKSLTPVEVFPGMIARHKDLLVDDISKARLAEAKRQESGPLNASGTMTLLTVESFARAVCNHRGPRTQVFADGAAGVIQCYFDHLANGAVPEDIGWGQHRAQITFVESRKLKEWRCTLAWMGQHEFANFLEDHLEDVIDPSGADLLGIATDLEASSSGGFKGRVNLDNGSVALHYQDDVETTVAIPRNLVLGIPLFEHGERYRLGVRLRFQIGGGRVDFRLLFTNLADAKEQEFERMVQDIEEKTTLPVYRGSLALPW